MKKLLILCLILASCNKAEKPVEKIFCNPLDLNYRFQPGPVAYRESADPAMVRYKDKFILFASHSSGYWISDDMVTWNHHPVKSLEIIEDYAPDAIVINDTVYYAGSASIRKPLWFTTDPLGDNWQQMKDTLPFSIWDPHFFLDDDGRRYLYWGCSNVDPIYGVELNSKMQAITEPVVFIEHNADKYGWENPGDNHEMTRPGWNEGSWMTKYNNRYYLQYSAPGTEFKTYADGLYTSDQPLGPYTYEQYSPFSYKPGGFAGGAGHSSTFMDDHGNYWHISTMTISIRHMFERRLGIYPAAFDEDGVMRTYTAFGDYPTVVPDKKIDFKNESLFKGWMLLSFKKNAQASSAMDTLPVENAFDENIRTWWSASSGDAGEWISVELDDNSTVNAIQVNFADNESTLKPDSRDIYYQYKLYASEDGNDWQVIADYSSNTKDAVHDFIILEKPVKTKFIKLENVKVPDGKFSVYDLRIFGKRDGEAPVAVNDFTVTRQSDRRRANIEWPADPEATGYIVNYGIDRNKLYTQVMVLDANSLELGGLNIGPEYYFSIDSFNESGITNGSEIIKSE